MEAVTTHLDDVLARTSGYSRSKASLVAQLPETLAWVTWAEIREIVVAQAVGFAHEPDGLAGTVDRLTSAVVTAIDWHG